MTNREAIEILKFERNHMIAALFTERIEAIDMAISALQQPEIIHCKDCKWWAVVPNDDSELSGYRACYALRHCRTKAIDFCSRAGRRTDEGSD